MLFTSAVFALGLLASSRSAGVDLELAGYVLDERKPDVLIRDPLSGYFLKRVQECDGGIFYMELTRDRRDIQGAGNEIGGKEIEGPIDKPLRVLGTGKGVKIGDTASSLTRRIGKPSKVARSGEHKQYTDFIYRFKTKNKRGDSEVFAETYTFKHGHLIQIVFDRSTGDS